MILIEFLFVLSLLHSTKTQLSQTEITLRPQPHYKKITLEKHLKDNGVLLEKHKILTVDGYFLTLFHFRLENFNSQRDNINKTPVLLVHGMAGDCSTFFHLKLKNTLPYLLMVNKNDVWCINLRGTIPSRKHKRYRLYSKSYWDFSWHENGVYDLPPAIDYIGNYTKRAKLIGIGHSSGNTVFYVLLSVMPEYNAKIQHVFSLAPTIAAKYLGNPFVLFLAKILPSVGFIQHFLYFIPIWPDFFGKVCRCGQLMVFVCTQTISLYFGYNSRQLNYKSTTTLLSSSPTSISTKMIYHFIQTHNSGNFSEYDYGPGENLRVYGTPHPRNYNTSNVMVPITLMYGFGDLLTPPEEIRYANELLPNSHMFLINCGNFNHIDFIVGKYANRCVYGKIVDTINRML